MLGRRDGSSVGSAVGRSRLGRLMLGRPDGSPLGRSEGRLLGTRGSVGRLGLGGLIFGSSGSVCKSVGKLLGRAILGGLMLGKVGSMLLGSPVGSSGPKDEGSPKVVGRVGRIDVRSNGAGRIDIRSDGIARDGADGIARDGNDGAE